MNKFNIGLLALAVGFCSVAMAQTLSKEEYEAGRAKIADEYQSAAARCASLSGNQNDICMAEAKGAEKVSGARLEARYDTNVKTLQQVRIAMAEADYAVAKERCDELSGDGKGVCLKKAEAAETAAKADATARMKGTDTDATAERYNDDSAISDKVKAALSVEPTLSGAESRSRHSKGWFN